MKKSSNKVVIDSLGLPMITNFEDLVMNLHLNGKLVYWLTSEDEKRYKTYYIEKKDGSKREINAPVLSLKIVQKWVLMNILYKIKTSPYTEGFKKDGSGSPLVRCAKKHRNYLFVMKMDIKDFYPSIHRSKVFNEFVNIGYNSIVSNLLTNICVLGDKLPQGAVTSAYLANLICRRLDFRIAGYCNKRDIVYTRYADDMFFSSDNMYVLKSIYGMIKKILKDEGFITNKNKTLFMTPKGHKRILGITINDNLIKAPRDMKQKVRALIHYQISTGDYSQNEQLKGYISYINSIEKDYKDKIKTYIRKLTESTLCMFDDVVDLYNENKIFVDLPDMKLKEATEFVDLRDADVFSNMIYSEHRQYLLSKNLIQEEFTFEEYTEENLPF